MSTAPFTRATGLPAGDRRWRFGLRLGQRFLAKTSVHAMLPAQRPRRRPGKKSAEGEFVLHGCHVLIPLEKKRGGKLSPPPVQNDLERCNRDSVVHFVRLATMALAAELRRLVVAGGGARRGYKARERRTSSRRSRASSRISVPRLATLTTFIKCWLWQVVHSNHGAVVVDAGG